MDLYFKLDLELLGDKFDNKKLESYFEKVKMFYSIEEVFIKIPRHGYECKHLVKFFQDKKYKVNIICAGYLQIEEFLYLELKYPTCEIIPLIENPIVLGNFSSYEKAKSICIGMNDLENIYNYKREDVMEFCEKREFNKKFDTCYYGGFSLEKIKSDLENVSARCFMVKNRNSDDFTDESINMLTQIFNKVEDIYKEEFSE